jgi:hypothetical protein
MLFFLTFYSNRKLLAFDHMLDTFPPGVLILFTEELSNRVELDYQKMMNSLNSKMNNDHRKAENDLWDDLLRLHQDAHTSTIDKTMALLLSTLYTS